mgnify:CR=1 FL=1
MQPYQGLNLQETHAVKQADNQGEQKLPKQIETWVKDASRQVYSFKSRSYFVIQLFLDKFFPVYNDQENA